MLGASRASADFTRVALALTKDSDTASVRARPPPGLADLVPVACAVDVITFTVQNPTAACLERLHRRVSLVVTSYQSESVAVICGIRSSTFTNGDCRSWSRNLVPVNL